MMNNKLIIYFLKLFILYSQKKCLNIENKTVSFINTLSAKGLERNFNSIKGICGLKNPSILEGRIFILGGTVWDRAAARSYNLYSSIFLYNVVNPIFNNLAASVLFPLVCDNTFRI